MFQLYITAVVTRILFNVVKYMYCQLTYMTIILHFMYLSVSVLFEMFLTVCSVLVLVESLPGLASNATRQESTKSATTGRRKYSTAIVSLEEQPLPAGYTVSQPKCICTASDGWSTL